MTGYGSGACRSLLHSIAGPGDEAEPFSAVVQAVHLDKIAGVPFDETYVNVPRQKVNLHGNLFFLVIKKIVIVFQGLAKLVHANYSFVTCHLPATLQRTNLRG